MTEAQAFEAIAARFASSWATTNPGVPIVLGNEAYPTQGVATFAALTFGDVVSRRLAMGVPGRRTHRGIVHVRTYSAIDVGDAAALALSASVRTALEDQKISAAAGDVFMWTAPLAQSAKQGNWYTRLVSIPFTFYS